MLINNGLFPVQRLNRQLASALRSEFYSKKLTTKKIKTAADWQNIPLTSKADLQSAYPFKMLAIAHSRVASYHESSGTSLLNTPDDSVAPTASMFTEFDWSDIVERFLRNAVQWTNSDRLLIKTPYSMVTTAHQAHRAAQRCGALIVPADNRSSIMPYSKVIRLLKDLGITTTWSLPTEPIIWALVARSFGFNPATDFPSLRAMLVAGEPLSAGKRRRISALWGGIPVYQDYGSTETGSLAGECEAGQLHLWNDRVFHEVIGVDGTSRDTGTGRLIVTPLYKEAMPLIRYDMSDTVTVANEGCACGSLAPTIVVHGRAESSAGIDQSTLDELVYGLPISLNAHLWRARSHAEYLEIELGCENNENHDISDELAHRIFIETGMRAEVTVVPVTDFLGPSTFSRQTAMQKPKFMFRPDESWANAFAYQ